MGGVCHVSSFTRVLIPILHQQGCVELDDIVDVACSEEMGPYLKGCSHPLVECKSIVPQPLAVF